MAIHALVNIIREKAKDGMVVIEVGVFHGDSVAGYVDTVRRYQGKILAIDWFKGSKSVTPQFPQQAVAYYDDKDFEHIFWDNVRLTNKDVVTVLKGDSVEMLNSLPAESADIIFIDGEHAYSKVYEDIKAALRVIKKDGILCGHDCQSLYSQAFQDWASRENDLCHLPENQWKLFGSDSIYELNCHANRHPGVIKAVGEHFGDNVQLLPDSVWVHYMSLDNEEPFIGS